jgi:hypothetical protein
MFDHKDDFIETFRRIVYPKIHEPLSRLGNKVGINLYAEGHVGYNQRVGTILKHEDTIERALTSLSGQRNVIACLKSLPDDRLSEGSWVFLHEDAPELIEEGMQVHVTLFNLKDVNAGREVYAHYEDDWRVSPINHLRAKNFDVKAGKEKMTEICSRSAVLEDIN